MAARSGAALALLETAIRPTTPDAERMNALSLFRGMADRAGGLSSFLGQFGSGSRIVESTPFVPYSTQRAETDQLRAELRDREARIASLEREVAVLRRENGQYRSKADVLAEKRQKGLKLNSDGSMAYLDFAREVQRRLVNADRSWQIAFEEQTGLSRTKFPRFLASKRVDDRAYIEAIQTLHEVDAPTRHEREWTKEEVQRIRYLTETKKDSEKNIAAIVSNEFGRRVTANMLKRLKINSRKRIGVFRDPSYGAPIGRERYAAEQ